MKKFRCVPLSMGIPIIFSLSALFWVPFLFNLDVFINSKGEPDPQGGLIVCVFAIVFSLSSAIASIWFAVKRVEIYPDRIVCKGLFPKDTFELSYDACNVGMDYHTQNGRKIWWVYFYSGPHPKYKTQNPASRINSIKIQPGFVRIMYDEELYQTLMETLPSKQCAALKSIRRNSGYDKQGRII